MRPRPVKLQFGLRTLAIVVAVCSMLALASKAFFNSLPGPHIPYGTDRELAVAIRDAFENPPVDGRAMRPGWAYITPSPPMKKIAEFGDEAIPVLVANINNKDQVMRLQVYQLLAMVDAQSAVPDLINALRYDDGPDDAFIVAKLAEITRHPEGYDFYRSWFSAETQREATEAYRRWDAERQSTIHGKPEQ